MSVEWIDLSSPENLKLKRLRGVLFVVEWKTIFKICQDISCVVSAAHQVNENIQAWDSEPTVKKHKKNSKTSTGDHEINLENCQEIEKRMSGPECQSHWVPDTKRIL